MRDNSRSSLSTQARGRLAAVLGAVSLLALVAAVRPAAQDRLPYRSPFATAYSPDGRLLAVSDRTAGSVAFFDATGDKLLRRASLSEPEGLAWAPKGGRLYVAEYGGSAVAEVDAGTGRVLRRMRVAPRPVTVAVSAQHNLLVVPCAALHNVSLVDLSTGREKGRVGCVGEPYGVTIVPNAGLAAVGNLLPGCPSTDPGNSASVTLIDLATCKRAADIRLPAGSVAVRDVVASADGKWLYAVHALGRFNLPTTQLDRGWISTNAMSIVDVAKRKVYATVLLDSIFEGAADPWGAAVSKDGSTMWISLSGTHQLARIELAKLHRYLTGDLPASSPLLNPSPEYVASSSNVWAEVKRDPAQRELLSTDLSAMHVAELLTRTDLPGYGPRGISLSPDGKRLAVAMYYSGRVQVVDTAAAAVRTTLSMGTSRPPDQARIGERMFHDGTLCFQHWLSCATCHPDGRADGFNWDLLNDGMGNPKNTRSLLQAQFRSPVMSHGVRSDYKVATNAGFRAIEFREPQPGEREAVEAYISSMAPQTSPYRTAGGGLSARAQRGKAIFESAKAKCISCHLGPQHTDQHLHDVGTRNEVDSSSRFVTATLTEVWRTAPYLHDGSAVTMQEVLTKHNRGNKHGATSHLTKQQIDDLAEYVLSL